MSANRWYAIQSPANSEAPGGVEISIYDEIGFGGVTAKDFLAEVKKYKGQHIDQAWRPSLRWPARKS